MSDDLHAGQEHEPITVYPDNWEGDVVLRDGRPCHIRPIQPEDEAALERFYGDLSEQSLYTRFFTASTELAARDIQRLINIDYRRRVALLATVGGRIIGIGVYDDADGVEAEIAFTISDDHQGRGLGSVLLEYLAAIARENGIHRFKAEVLSDNKNMLRTFTAAGYVPSQTITEGVVNLDFDIDPTSQIRAIARLREHRAESLSIQRLIAPTNIAVMCAEVSDGSPGELLVANLLSGGFTGRLWVVSPTGDGVHDAPGFGNLAAVGHRLDLVVMALSPDQARAAVGQCAAAGVRGIVLVTDGFDPREGCDRQFRLARMIREEGMRLVGPNALGLINTDPRVRLNASLETQLPGRGRVGVFCQTAVFGSAILREAAQRGLGVSSFVSVGDRADVSSNDFLQYWEDDDSTALVLLHTESIGNPRKFIRIARRLALNKPVVAVRSARSTQTLRVAHSVRHTQLPAVAVDAMFDQAGVIQVDSLSQMFDLAGLLAFQPLPGGPNVAFITDSDALRLVADDASQSLGLVPVGDVQIFDPQGTSADHEALISQSVSDPRVDTVIVTHVPTPLESSDALRDAVLSQARSSTKPVIAVVLAQGSDLASAANTAYGMPAHGSVPVFSDVESALRSLSAAVEYARWVGESRGIVPDLHDVEPRRAEGVVTAALASASDADATTPLTIDQLTAILNSYGINLSPSIPVNSEEQAVAIAAEIGYPIVLKFSRGPLVHRADLGGVRLALENEAALRTAYLSMRATMPDETAHGLEVQRMAPTGVACVVQTSEDPLFGPVVSFRLAGLVPELLEDVAFRIAPLTDEDARALVHGPQSAPLLLGGGANDVLDTPPVDLKALEDLLIRLGQLADHLPEIAHLELNPIIVHSKGVEVLRASGSVARPQIRTDLQARRLL